MTRKYIIVTDDSFKGFDEEIENLERKWGAEEIEPCDDCISRQATVERLCKIAEFMNEKRNGLGSPYVMAALFIQDNKDEFPPVTPQPKMGKWIEHEQNGIAHIECSKCLSWFLRTHLLRNSYCPNCGAKMEVSE